MLARDEEGEVMAPVDNDDDDEKKDKAERRDHLARDDERVVMAPVDDQDANEERNWDYGGEDEYSYRIYI